MITTKQAIEKILRDDIRARTALEAGYMNYSQYAKLIKSDVGVFCKKNINHETIMIALTRIAKFNKNQNKPPTRIFKPKGITITSPLTELSYEKNQKNLKRLAQFFEKTEISNDDFLTITYSLSHISITTQNHLLSSIKKYLGSKPRVLISDIAAISLSMNEGSYEEPGVTHSFIEKIAARGIPLAETITSHTEIIFTFKKNHLHEIVDIFG